MGLLNLPGLSVEECPLVVGSMSHSSRVVMGERMQIVTVFPSAAETNLSSSPNMAPRISTSSSNMTGGDVRRVIQQNPASSPSRVLVGSGAGRCAVRRPTKQSTGRGQVLAAMLADGASGTGMGQSAPSPPVGRSEQGERWTSTRTESRLPPAVMMQLDHQGPVVTYSEAASRPPQRTVIPSPELTSGDVHIKLAACKKEKEAARATLEQIQRQE